MKNGSPKQEIKDLTGYNIPPKPKFNGRNQSSVCWALTPCHTHHNRRADLQRRSPEKPYLRFGYTACQIWLRLPQRPVGNQDKYINWRQISLESDASVTLVSILPSRTHSCPGLWSAGEWDSWATAAVGQSCQEALCLQYHEHWKETVNDWLQIINLRSQLLDMWEARAHTHT